MPPEGPEEPLVLLKAELRHRGMSEREIHAVLRKKKRRKVLEFYALRYRSLLASVTPRRLGAIR